MKARRVHSIEFKKQVVREYSGRQAPLVQLSRRHELSESLIGIWVGKYQRGELLAGSSGSTREKQLETRGVESRLLRCPSGHCIIPKQAIRLAESFKALNVGWFEEPVLADDIPGLARVAANTTIPVAPGEHEYTKYGFREERPGNGIELNPHAVARYKLD